MSKALSALLVVALLIFALTHAQAHSWYEFECCSDKDCKPLDYTPRLVPGGYQLRDGTVFRRELLRPSRDDRWHECRIGGVTPRCLYMPAGS